MEKPESTSELRWCLGIFRQATGNVKAPTRPSQHYVSVVVWSAESQTFAQMKKELYSSGAVLAHYNATLETIVSAIAPSYVLGSVLQSNNQ